MRRTQRLGGFNVQMSWRLIEFGPKGYSQKLLVKPQFDGSYYKLSRQAYYTLFDHNYHITISRHLINIS